MARLRSIRGFRGCRHGCKHRDAGRALYFVPVLAAKADTSILVSFAVNFTLPLRGVPGARARGTIPIDDCLC